VTDVHDAGQSVRLRHFTESMGCVEPAPPSTPYVDECYANFRRLGGSDQMFCDDPYFGGKSDTVSRVY